MALKETIDKLKNVLTMTDLTEVKLNITELIPQLQEDDTAHSEEIATRDKTIDELNTSITEKDERVKELEDSNRVLLERYGAVVMQDKKDDDNKDEEETAEANFDEFIIKV